MKRVVLSAPARADLEAIAASRREHRGDRRTQAYLAAFTACFKALAAMPNLGRPRDDLDPAVRSILVGRHLAFSRQAATRIDISRVVRVRQDIVAAFDD